ncbi:MAG: class I SAM-dependent methyltransferase [Actinomycetota bacterium]|nr:class I SAM-dependent methyltransferase [Actinomycetota bacterium]
MTTEPEAKEKDLPRSPFPSWCSFLLTHPWRKREFDREKIIEQAGIAPGMTVLELGCGPGFFTEFIARKLSPTGRVISQDVVPAMIAKLKKRMRRFPVTENIEPLLAGSSNIGLEAESIDLIFAANVFEEIVREGEIVATVDELHRVLKPGHTLYFGEHRVPARTIAKIFGELERVGFTRSEVPEKHFVHSAVFTK